MNKSLKIFIAYAYKDTKAKDQLMICLHRIKSEGLISIWHDNEILAGDKWRDVISTVAGLFTVTKAILTTLSMILAKR